MADVAHGLRIKYGLVNSPSPSQVQEWANLAKRYISQGMSPEAAGHSAAKYLFRDYRTNVYASEADTIEMLLREVGK